MFAAYEFNRNTATLASQRDYAAAIRPGVTLYPELRRNNVAGRVRQQITPTLTFSVDGLFNTRSTSNTFPLNAAGDLSVSAGRSFYTTRGFTGSAGARTGAAGSVARDSVGQLRQAARPTTAPTISSARPGSAREPGFFRNRGTTLELSGDGNLLRLPGGVAKLAVGAGFRRNTFERFTGVGVASNIDQQQESYYGFAELSAPLLPKLVASGAVRYERYRGLGSVATPKFGLIYSPVPDFDIKGSWGQSFRAPTLYLQYQPPFAYLAPANQYGGSASAAVLYITGGNTDLRPERSTNWSLSFDLHPRAMRGFDLQVSYFSIDYTDRDRHADPVSLDVADQRRLRALCHARTEAPQCRPRSSTARRTFTNLVGGTYDPTTVVALVRNNYVNAGAQTINGVDAQMRYKTKSGDSDFEALLDVSYLSSKQQITSSQPVTPLAGILFNPAQVPRSGGAVLAAWRSRRGRRSQLYRPSARLTRGRAVDTRGGNDPDRSDDQVSHARGQGAAGRTGFHPVGAKPVQRSAVPNCHYQLSRYALRFDQLFCVRAGPQSVGIEEVVTTGAFAAALVSCLAALPAYASCDDTVQDKPAGRPVQRDVTARDLIELRYIGEPSPAHLFGASPLGVSPDGAEVALVLAKPDLASNGECRALLVLDIASGVVRTIDTGGERMSESFPIRGVRITDGWPDIVTPIWSPDGRKVGYLKRVGGIVQLWIARADGQGATPITSGSADIENWTWAPDGRSLIYATRSGQAAAAASIDREGHSGYLYDAKIWPDWGPTPLSASDAPLDVVVSDETGATRMANGAERQLLAARGLPGQAGDDTMVSVSGRKALTKLDPRSELGPRRLTVIDKDGSVVACDAPACRDGVVQIWWDGATLLYLHREGWANEATALYRWTPRNGAPRRVFVTTDTLLGCRFARWLICTEENATTPRRIAAYDVKAGTKRVLFDPNPQFAGIRLGHVERLRVTNAYGLPSWADLVLPPGYKSGAPLPTIVVQYHSRGFLRGGTGDEYPIFLFAARGYAVLSLERPPGYRSNDPTITTYAQLNAVGAKDWMERRNLFSSVRRSIEMAVSRGFADPARIGITGLSDGTSTVQFAMVNSKAFAAASISSGLFAPTLVMTDGIGWADYNKSLGYPPLTKPDTAFWKPMSFAENADAITTPLLIQMADREYLQGLEGFTALREAGKPVELYVFPDEYHNKRQPIHRLAVYRRNLDWFDFWLRDREDPDPAKAAQYRRWRAMRQSVTKR